MIHDRDAIFSAEMDQELRKGFGLKVLRTPPQSPRTNVFCERLVGTVRRECLDFLIPVNERHLRRLLREWVGHYNGGRPHSSLGPGVPDRYGIRQTKHPFLTLASKREVTAYSVLGGLYHEYAWKRVAA
jgi:putative transposase